MLSTVFSDVKKAIDIRGIKKETKQMKKLMIAAAIVCAAAFANAATVSWTIGVIYDAPEAGGWGEGSAGEGYTGVLSFYSDSAMQNLVTSATITEWSDGVAEGETDNLFTYDPATTYYGKLVCTTSVNGELQTLESQAFKFTTNPMEAYPSIVVGTNPEDIGGRITDLDGNEFTGDHGAFSASGWTAAPEPTSGLLLLIGVAGLALRRRRA